MGRNDECCVCGMGLFPGDGAYCDMCGDCFCPDCATRYLGEDCLCDVCCEEM